MNIHENARLTPLRRGETARLVASGQVSKAQAGRHFGVSIKTVSRWVSRYGQDGFAAMIDRSSRPHHSPRRIVPPLEQAIITALKAGGTLKAQATTNDSGQAVKFSVSLKGFSSALARSAELGGS